MNKDDCESSPCLNNGICIDEINGFHCNCSSTGYSGFLCQNNENECKRKPNVCLNDGICYDTYGSYICECPPNYTGFNCEQLIDPCFTNPCGHGGSCVSRSDTFQCICSIGYSGELCENGPVCPIECPRETICIAGKCCEPDSSGKQCIASHLDDCHCLNGGTCNKNGSACICPDGFDGDLCENDINECKETPNICVHGICVNQPGTFKCYCEPGNSFSFSFFQIFKIFFSMTLWGI